MRHTAKNIIPGSPGEFNCIWAASNIIDNKLCEKDFDCEDCALDKILRNLFPDGNAESGKNLILDETNFLEALSAKLENLTNDSRLIYVKNNLVIKHLFANIYYLGINPVTLSLLDNFKSVKENMRKVYFNKGQLIFSAEGDWGHLNFEAPMNFLLLDKLNWTPEDIINRHWIALIVVNQSEILEAQTSTDEWKTEKAKLVKLLIEFRNNCLLINQSLLSKGNKINYLYQLIGGDEYLKLLEAHDFE
jgi:hypothetical protein